MDGYDTNIDFLEDATLEVPQDLQDQEGSLWGRSPEPHGFSRDLEVAKQYLDDIGMLPREDLKISEPVLVEVGMSLYGSRTKFSTPPKIQWFTQPCALYTIIMGEAKTTQIDDNEDSGKEPEYGSERFCIALERTGLYRVPTLSDVEFQQLDNLSSSNNNNNKDVANTVPAFVAEQLESDKCRACSTFGSALLAAVPNLAPDIITLEMLKSAGISEE